jgi:hypothetical protein
MHVGIDEEVSIEHEAVPILDAMFYSTAMMH